MNNIYLTGFMSSGKTTVSMLLSETLNKPLYDTDDLIINKTNLTINDIFLKFGEEYFRELETEILEEVSKKENAIISTGGGIILRDRNRQIMHETGKIIYLNAKFSVIEERLENARKSRPLLMEETEKIRKRFDDRQPLYKDCDFEIKITKDMTPKKITDIIISYLEDIK